MSYIVSMGRCVWPGKWTATNEGLADARQRQAGGTSARKPGENSQQRDSVQLLRGIKSIELVEELIRCVYGASG